MAERAEGGPLASEGGMEERQVLQRVPPELRHLTGGILPRRLVRMLDVLDQRMVGLSVVVEAVRRRHNVSAILRTADAMGLHRVHLVTGSFKPSLGAARGAERWLDLQIHRDTASCVESLQRGGVRVYAADLAEDAVTPEEIPVESPVAILVGSEHSGVSEEARGLVDGSVKVPMYGFAESLNVSVATAVVLRAVAERRRLLVGPDLSPGERVETLARWLGRESSYMGGARGRAR